MSTKRWREAGSSWVDDFDGPAGAPPDPAVWAFELGDGGWGDGQLQHYTPPPANAALDGHGCLAITARRDSDGRGSSRITSARLTTKDRLTVHRGRVEARVRLPAGAGLWSAFWMLGDDLDAVGWPACGEIDVLEHVGHEPGAVHGTLHLPGHAGVGAGVGRVHRAEASLADAFHVHGIDWADDHVAWTLDGVEHSRVEAADVDGPWPFRHPFFLLLNLAVGGGWPGLEASPDAAALPAAMLVDHVRVSGSTVRRAVGA